MILVNKKPESVLKSSFKGSVKSLMEMILKRRNALYDFRSHTMFNTTPCSVALHCIPFCFPN